MVCPRCIEAVRVIFSEAGSRVLTVDLGKVKLDAPLRADQKSIVAEKLASKGFELLDDKQSSLINRIKSVVVDHIHHKETPPNTNFSALLSKSLHRDYAYLSRLFSSVEGQTLERYIQAQKIEKVKEWLTYDEWTISEIAYRLNYSSPAHLSTQFKNITGMSPTAFKRLQHQNRQFLDGV